jgi:hypothetical protein
VVMERAGIVPQGPSIKEVTGNILSI